MLISRKWLQRHIQGDLPSGEVLADTLMLHSFEIEEVIEKADDVVIDIDVLPNRAHDCLGYAGIAKELAGILQLTLVDGDNDLPRSNTVSSIDVHVPSDQQCYRYSATCVSNIKHLETPPWMTEALAEMGQKSINLFVDITNYVLFDIGQPMHVFDADKIMGDITVRNAYPGEVMEALGGDTVELSEDDLVIADTAGVLALAGVKGGTRAEVDHDTTRICIESACFNPLTTRVTARRVKIQTDSSKRFENEITPERAYDGLVRYLNILADIQPDVEISATTDVYTQMPDVHIVELSHTYLESRLGIAIDSSRVEEILRSQSYSFESHTDVYVITIPHERLDLRTQADMVEEIGRLYGYHHIESRGLDDITFTPRVNKNFLAAHMLRNYFVENGFTEIMDYSFVKKGVREVKNPLASDKKALRKNLSKQMKDSLVENARIADYLQVDQTLIFEIDQVDTDTGPEYHCCFGIDPLSKKSRKTYGSVEVQQAQHIQAIADLFGLSSLETSTEAAIVSFNIKQCELGLDAETYGTALDIRSFSDNATFTGISAYPYMKRDVSFWIEGSDAAKCKQQIVDAGTQHMKKIQLFDLFEKEGRTSLAFNMIFQSSDRTLTDTDVDNDMQKINQALEKIGAELR